MAEIHIRGKTNGSIVTIHAGRIVETLPEWLNVTGATSLGRLTIVDEPGADTFTLSVPEGLSR